MTTIRTSSPASATSRSRMPPVAVAACTTAGVAFVVDTVTIAVLDRPFDPLDSILFCCGLVATVVGVVAAAVALSRGRTPRALWAVGILVAVIAVIGVVAQVGDTLAHHYYAGGNLGLRTEWSFFLTGVQLLVLAGVVRRGVSSPTRHQDA